MNQSTLERLQNNPHYKLSAKQKKALEEQNRKSMIQFGKPRIHNTSFNKHQDLEREEYE